MTSFTIMPTLAFDQQGDHKWWHINYLSHHRTRLFVYICGVGATSVLLDCTYKMPWTHFITIWELFTDGEPQVKSEYLLLDFLMLKESVTEKWTTHMTEDGHGSGSTTVYPDTQRYFPVFSSLLWLKSNSFQESEGSSPTNVSLSLSWGRMVSWISTLNSLLC